MKNPMMRLLAQNPNIRCLWLGESISNFGDYFYDVAIMWIVFLKTGSATQSGLMLVASFLPQVLVGPFLGAVADKFSQKRMMLYASVGQAILTGALAVLIATAQVQMWEMYVITLLLSVGQLTYSPARSAMFPDIVEQVDLLAANSVFTSSRQIIRIVGSVAGGTIVAFMGPTASITLNALSFVAGAFFIMKIRHVSSVTQTPSTDKKTTILHDMKEGWRWLFGQPVLLVLIGIGTVTNIALGPTNVLPPMLIKQSLHGNSLWLGTFDAAIGLGILLGGIVIGSLSPKKIGLFFTFGIGLQGVSMAVVSLANSLILACIGNFILGVAVIVTGLPMSTMFQVLIPSHIRGRVNSISSMLFSIAIPVTYGGIGLLGDLIGSRSSYGLGALLFLLCVVTSLSVAQIRRLTMDSPAPAPAESTAGVQLSQ